jgi:hypothetical protein
VQISYNAGVAELADAAGLGPAVPKGLGGSNPSARTKTSVDFHLVGPPAVAVYL